MLFLKIENLSGFLSRSKFVVYSGGRPIYLIEEILTSPFKRIIGLTKFRMLSSLELELMDLESKKTFRIKRKVSYPYHYYTLNREDNHRIASFEPGKRGWKWLQIRSPLNYLIKDGDDKITGITHSKNPLIIGVQHGEVEDISGQTIATYEWKRFSLWKGYRECELLISRHDKDWILISIAVAIIKGLYLQQR